MPISPSQGAGSSSMSGLSGLDWPLVLTLGVGGRCCCWCYSGPTSLCATSNPLLCWGPLCLPPQQTPPFLQAGSPRPPAGTSPPSPPFVAGTQGHSAMLAAIPVFPESCTCTFQGVSHRRSVDHPRLPGTQCDIILMPESQSLGRVQEAAFPPTPSLGTQRVRRTQRLSGDE